MNTSFTNLVDCIVTRPGGTVASRIWTTRGVTLFVDEFFDAAGISMSTIGCALARRAAA